MLTGGNVTIYVSDMTEAVRFYTEVLGLKLRERYGDHWASVDAGNGLTIGLHPATPQVPAGRPGSMAIGFEATQPIAEVVRALTSKGVKFAEAGTDKVGAFAHFTDPDGNPCYLFQLKAEYTR
jgi:catechol 2,3-dioxygenase-like lactoylglutathione lyase family enzyme